MALIVRKYGGTSVGDLEQIETWPARWLLIKIKETIWW